MKGNTMNEKDTCCSTPQTIKLFDECGTEEQVKRLKTVIRNLQQEFRWVHSRAQRYETKIFALERHQHSQSGDCMLRIEDANRDGNQLSESSPKGIDILD